MFRRLRKVAKPRTKKKIVDMTIKFSFEVADDNDSDAKLVVRKFKQWMKDQFTEWDNSILQYFLYAYGLVQDPDGEKYKLDVHIDKILRDDSSTVSEIKELNEKNEVNQDDFEDDLEIEYEDEVEETENLEEQINSWDDI